MQIFMYPKVWNQMQQEIFTYHPTLITRLSKHQDSDFVLQVAKCIAEICKYCDTEIDGTFDINSLESYAKMCLQLLKEKRESVDSEEVIRDHMASLNLNVSKH